MYKPNRIGPWAIHDLSQNEIILTSQNITDWSSHQPANNEVKIVQPLLAQEHDNANIRLPQGQDGTMAPDDTLAIGIAVAGNQEEAVQYSVIASYAATASKQIHANIIMGQTTAAVIAPARLTNQVQNTVILPHTTQLNQHTGNNKILVSGSVETCLINTGTQIGNPIVAALQIVAVTQTNNPVEIEIENLHISISIQKYVGEIKTFDPVR